MPIATFCFVTSTLAALGGMNLGLYMGIEGDFTLVPVHAHLNLLGWVTMALYGLYHRGVLRDGNRLPWLQVGCGAAGFPLMAGGLAAYLTTGNAGFIGVVMLGAALSLTGMLLFLGIIVTDALRASAAVPPGGGERAHGW